MSDKLRELSVPKSIAEDDEGTELLRFWVANNVEHLSIRIGEVAEPEKEPEMWGMVLADVTKHVINSMRQHYPDGYDAQQIFDRIMKSFSARLQSEANKGSAGKTD